MLSGLVSSGLTGPIRSRAARPFRQIMSRGCEIAVPSTFFQTNNTVPGLLITMALLGHHQIGSIFGFGHLGVISHSPYGAVC